MLINFTESQPQRSYIKKECGKMCHELMETFVHFLLLGKNREFVPTPLQPGKVVLSNIHGNIDFTLFFIVASAHIENLSKAPALKMRN